MKNYEMYDLELEEMVADEVFPETNNPYDSENFPTKDRKQAANRRKKGYLKGKKRVDSLYARTKKWSKYPKRNESVLRGIMQKTNVVEVEHDKGINRAAIRRDASVNDKMVEYNTEV